MKWFAFRSTTFSCTSFPTNPKGLLLFSCERIYVFLHTYLIAHYIFLQLCTYVFFYLFCILPYCINIIASTPKVAIPIFIFEICKFVKNHQRTFPFEVSYNLLYRVFGRDSHKHRDMILTIPFCMC